MPLQVSRSAVIGRATPALLDDGARHLLDQRRAIDQQHTAAFAGNGDGDLLADALRRAGDDDALAREARRKPLPAHWPPSEGENFSKWKLAGFTPFSFRKPRTASTIGGGRREIDVDIAAMERGVGQVMRHIALQRMAARRIGDDRRESEAGDGHRESLELVHRHEVGVVRHAVDHMDGLGGARRLQHLQHRQERGEPGATGQEQRGPLDGAQVEGADRPRDRERVARRSLVAEVGRHQAARNVADKELDLAILRHRREGVGAGLARPRNGDIDILARQEGECVRLGELDREADRRGGELPRLDEGGGHGAGLDLAGRRGSRMRMTQSDCAFIWQVRTKPSAASSSVIASSM